jgi:hypothetical protein
MEFCNKKTSSVKYFVCATLMGKKELKVHGISCSLYKRDLKFLNRMNMLCIIYIWMLLNDISLEVLTEFVQ